MAARPTASVAGSLEGEAEVGKQSHDVSSHSSRPVRAVCRGGPTSHDGAPWAARRSGAGTQCTPTSPSRTGYITRPRPEGGAARAVNVLPDPGWRAPDQAGSVVTPANVAYPQESQHPPPAEHGSRLPKAASLPWPRSSAIKACGRTRWLGGAASGGNLIQQPTSPAVPSRLTSRHRCPIGTAGPRQSCCGQYAGGCTPRHPRFLVRRASVRPARRPAPGR
jgi:hypothetical protein